MRSAISFPAGEHTLGGVLFRPEGEGPFPVFLFNHGSAPGRLNDQAFEQLGPVFAERGWVFFAPYRRGQGSSADAGPYIGDAAAAAQAQAAQSALPVVIASMVLLIAVLMVSMRRRRVWLRGVSVAAVAVLAVAAFALIGMNARAAATVRLLETDHLEDHLAALAWLKTQAFVQADRIATGGNSFGGIVTVLAAERVPYCAAVDAAGGAQTWWSMPQLRSRMARAVQHAQAPIYFFQAGNDYSTSPSRTLAAQMQQAGKPFELKLYPAYGSSAADGHAFAWRGSAIWAPDVFRFLDTHCGPGG